MSIFSVLGEHNASPELLTSGQIKIHCPFKDKHSSESRSRKQMFLSPHINAYHCFSCQSKGRLTKLLVDKYEVPFYEAVEMVHIDEYVKAKKENLEEEDYYWDLKLPKVFADRGFKKELVVDKFRVGIRDEMTIIPNYWDGVLKGIVFRIDEEGEKKKVWSSSNFNKEEFLYNGDAAYKDYVILVEGQTDVWRMISYGYQAYGTLGTNLSDWQANYLSKIKHIYIAADCDNAGINAANNWYKKLHKHTDVSFINYPAKDPDSCSYRNFKKAFENSVNYAIFRLETGL